MVFPKDYKIALENINKKNYKIKKIRRVRLAKVTGFLEHDRKDRNYYPVKDRIKSFKEFLVPLSEKDLKTKPLDAWIVEYLIAILVVQ